MTLRRLNPLTGVAALLAFALTLLALTLLNGGGHQTLNARQSAAAGGSPSPAPKVRSLQAAIRAHPDRGDAYSLLADAYLQRTRETGDYAYYTPADGILRRALRMNPRDAGALTTYAALAASR